MFRTQQEMEKASTIRTFDSLMNFILEHNKLGLPDTRLKIVDLGCGSGALMRHYRGRGHFAVGIDIDKNMISCWQDQQNVVGDFHTLPFGDEKFDLVVSTYILDYQKPGMNMLKLERLACEIQRVLLPGGFYFCGFDTGCSKPQVFEELGFRLLKNPITTSISGLYQKII